MANYVTFEQAKWLKEKEFDVPVRQRWSIVENIDGDKSSFLQEEGGLFDWNNGKYPEYYSAPEQHQVIEWLRVNHSVWVYSYNNGNCWIASIQKTNGSIIRILPANNSPQEAYSAAFDYIRNNNLI